MSQVPTQSPPPYDPATSKRMTAGLLGLFLGSVGAHRFYLGDQKGGWIRVALCCVGGGFIGFIEGIMYLMKTDEQFYQEYIVNKKAWF